MANERIKEDGSYRVLETGELRLMENSKTQDLNNYKFVSSGEGMSVTEKI